MRLDFNLKERFKDERFDNIRKGNIQALIRQSIKETCQRSETRKHFIQRVCERFYTRIEEFGGKKDAIYRRYNQ